MVRPLRAGESPRWRDLRLNALRDAPEAFMRTYEEEHGLDAAEWERRTNAFAAAGDRVMFVADAGDGRDWFGSAGVMVDAGDGTPEVIAVWVAPERRGRGVGEALVRAGIDWARGRGARRLRLHVGPGIPHAVALYERLGFRRTGATIPMRDPAIRAEEMALELGSRG